MHTIRKRIGHKAISPKAQQDIVEMGKKLDTFYTITPDKMEMKKTEEKETNGKNTKKVVTYEEQKNIVHVKNTSDFVQHIIQERHLDPSTAVVRIGLDSGGGSMKVIASIFDPDTESPDDNEEDMERENEGKAGEWEEEAETDVKKQPNSKGKSRKKLDTGYN